ncbi:MAG: hypothetical protein ACKO3K_20940 [Cuspidothrix sp.]
MSKLDLSELKDLLKRSGEITDNSIVRKNFCTYIGITIDDISPDGVASLNNDQFIDTLLGYLERTDNTSAFYQLCIKLEPHFKSPGELQDELNNIKDKLCPKQQDNKIKQSCLLVAVHEDNKGIRLEAWLSNHIGDYLPLLKKEPSILQIPSKEFPDTFRKVYQNCLEEIRNNDDFPCKYISKIKVFLPYNLFIKNNHKISSIDTLVIDETVPKAERITFGEMFEVTLEFLERFNENKLYNHTSMWHKKCDSFRKRSDKSVKDIFFTVTQLDVNNRPKLKKDLLSDDVIGITFINFINLKTIGEILFYNGIPFALWIRKDIKEINIQETLNNIITEVNYLEKLPSIIKGERINAKDNKNHIGNHLSLICDTDNLLPPTSKLSMP